MTGQFLCILFDRNSGTLDIHTYAPAIAIVVSMLGSLEIRRFEVG
jgi:hypothetical protein